MEAIRKYIYEQVAAQRLQKSEAKKMLFELADAAGAKDDIAIIGIAGIFPGADSLEEYWGNIRGMKNCVGIPSAERREIWKSFYPEYFDSLSNEKERFEVRGYLREIDKFDCEFFRISSKEARFMDPLHRIFLETAYHAVESSGMGKKQVNASRTGVFVGYDNADGTAYGSITDRSAGMALTGLYTALLSSRISYILNLKGKSIVLDTACSSALTAVHEACAALRNKDCDMALVGGVYLINNIFRNPDNPINMIVAADGMVRTFDNNATGTVLGEGSGVVLLKPFKKAIKDMDNIHAVIKGSAVNNDGASNGITAPNANAQTEVLLEAWKNAAIDPETIDFIEAHGTGTVLGDPIEIKAITKAFLKHTDKKQFCGIGSVKSNIGHTVSASGMAALLKMVLALKSKELPGNINFENPNRYIEFCESPVYVNDTTGKWEKRSSPRRCGVSSFGFSGTNCHVVLEEAPENSNVPAHNEKRSLKVLTLTALSQKAMTELAGKYLDFLKNNSVNIDDLCFTANTAGSNFKFRAAIVFEKDNDLKRGLYWIKNGSTGLIRENIAIFAGKYELVSNMKKDKAEGDISEQELADINRRAASLADVLGSEAGQKQELICELCRLYVRGAEIDWSLLYKEEKHRREALPLYPFERVSYWHSIETKASFSGTGEEAVSPLVHRLLVKSMLQDIYETVLNVEDFWVVREHRIMGSHYVPMTAYLEMIYAVGRTYYPGKDIEIKDAVFLKPLIVERERAKSVHTVIDKKDGYYSFYIASKAEEGEKSDFDGWIKHAQGIISEAAGEKQHYFDLQPLLSKININSNGNMEVHLNSNPDNIIFGKRWIESMQRADMAGDEVLAQIELPEVFKDDMKDYLLHPALLDNAVNAVIHNVGEGMYLPLAYKSFKVYTPLPQKVYSLLEKVNRESKDEETISFNIKLIAPSGEVIGEIREYTIKRVHGEGLMTNNNSLPEKSRLFNRIAWVPEELEASGNTGSGGTTLVISDGSPLSKKFVQKIVDRGFSYAEIKIGQRDAVGATAVGGSEAEYLRIFSQAGNEITRIVHFSVDDPIQEIKDMNDFHEKNKYGLYSLFYLVKALVQSKVRNNTEIILLSSNAFEVTGNENILEPQNAMLFGLGRALKYEYPNLNFRCIDVEGNNTPEAVLDDLLSCSKSFISAYRDGKRYVEEFRPFGRTGTVHKEAKIKKHGVYLITGGTGGIGLEMAKYLLAGGAANIALLGKTELPEDRKDEKRLSDIGIAQKLSGIKALEEMGGNICYFNTDLTDYAKMEELIARLRSRYGRINGVIHSAGAAGKGFVFKESYESLLEVILPKAYGALLLHRITLGDNPDFFVMNSSIASIYGIPGQGDYSAANAYLDAFAAYRNKLGYHTLTINWTTWVETGMALKSGIREDGVFKGIDTKTAVEAFDAAMKMPGGRIVIGELNKKLIASSTGELPVRLSREILDSFKEAAGTSANPGRKNQRSVTLRGKTDGEYSATEREIAALWGRVLESDSIDIYSSFYSMGGDSILAVELLKAIEGGYPGIVDITDIFTYSSVYELAHYIDTKAAGRDAVVENAGGKEVDEEILDLFRGLESGDFTIEDGLEMIDKINKGDKR